MKDKRAAQRLRWSRQAPVWRRPSPRLTSTRRKERPWIFLVSMLVVHGAAVLLIPRTEAARKPPRPAPLVVERITRPPPPPAPPAAPAPVAPPPVQRRAPVAKRARVVEVVEVTPEPPSPPKKIVGLSLAATVGGAGPAFRVGESRRGTTELTPPQQVPLAAGPAASGAPGPSAPQPLELPRRLRTIEPIYPEEYRDRRIEGQVTLSLLVEADGSVGEVALVTPSPHPAFNRSAVATAKREHFSPATRGGVPIPHTIRCTYHFKLSS